MDVGALLILATTAAVIAAILCVVWLMDRVKPDEIYRAPDAPETPEQRYRKAHSEDGI